MTLIDEFFRKAVRNKSYAAGGQSDLDNLLVYLNNYQKGLNITTGETLAIRGEAAF